MDFANSPFEIKAIDEAGYIAGIAASYGGIDRGGDRIMPGAMTKAVEGRRSVPMLLNHNHAAAIGGWHKFDETPAGLAVEGRIAIKTPAGRDAHAVAESGGLPGLSIGYKTVRHIMAGSVRQLHELDLWEVSLVPVPMDPRSVVTSIKSIATAGDIRDLFREAGFSSREAKAAAGAAWKAIHDQTDEPDTASLAAIINASAARIAGL